MSLDGTLNYPPTFGLDGRIEYNGPENVQCPAYYLHYQWKWFQPTPQATALMDRIDWLYWDKWMVGFKSIGGYKVGVECDVITSTIYCCYCAN